ncbi:MAG TPA: hypothetical protein VG603_05355, partial [Chitinophagales bacterium]|nr:hypothetical protein [Chitinophagales bacterium]
MKKYFAFAALLLFLFMAGCIASHKTADSVYHSSYDDTSLLVKEGPMLLPYNRFIDGAGSVVHFGDGNLENHSLDCVLLPDGKTLAVEGRFGITFIDVTTKKVVFELENGGKGKHK